MNAQNVAGVRAIAAFRWRPAGRPQRREAARAPDLTTRTVRTPRSRSPLPDHPLPTEAPEQNGMTMTDTITGRLRGLASPRRSTAPRRGTRRAAVLLLQLMSVALLGWIGYIHLHLWLEGYRQIPTDGPLFLLDAVAGLTLAATLLVWPAPLTRLLAIGYTAGTLGALLISLTVGLFGFHESISASYVTLSLLIEAITVLVLASWIVLAAIPGRPAPTTTNPAPSPQHPVATR